VLFPWWIDAVGGQLAITVLNVTGGPARSASRSIGAPTAVRGLVLRESLVVAAISWGLGAIGRSAGSDHERHRQ
jgi:hypothetical protein